MTDMLDLEPPARHVAELLDGVHEGRLDDPTPCESYAVRDLVTHLLGLATVFREAAHKNTGGVTAQPPEAALATPLPGDWRERLREQLNELAAAWSVEAAWQGGTQAGGQTLPAETAGRIALNELVLHGWDLARATDQPYVSDPASLRASAALLEQALDPAAREGMFGPVVDVPPDAPLLDRVVGLSGRRPDWAASA